MSIEGVDWKSVPKEPSLLRSPEKRLTSILSRHLAEEPGERSGRAIAIHGEHGTGKTHTVLHAIATVLEQEPLDSRRAIVLYARADGSDILGLYRKLAGRLTVTELRELAAQAFAGYAAEVFEESRVHTDQKAQEFASTRLRTAPGLVFSAVKEQALSWSSIVDKQDEDIDRAQGRVGRYERAVRGLLSPELAKTAYAWLLGRTINDTELRRLGIASNIHGEEDARTAIHVLATLARRARRPFFVILDQVETLLLGPQGRLDKTVAGFLRSTSESVVRENGVMIVSMNEFAWRLIPKDLKQRFGPSVIQVQALTMREAWGLLCAYLAQWASTESAYYPFTEESVRELLMQSGGNARRYIQAAYLAFEAAFPNNAPISRTLVQSSVDPVSTEVSPSEEDVRATMELLLRSTGERFAIEYRVGEVLVDFAVLRDSGAPLLFIMSGPVFEEGDANRVLSMLDQVRAASPAEGALILIVVGYSSPDVVYRLKMLAEHVVVADESGFDKRLEVILTEELVGVREILDAPPEADSLSVRVELAALQEARNEDERRFSEKLSAISEVASKSRRGDQVRDFKALWSQERQRLVLGLRAARADQEKADIEEVALLHRVEIQRQRQGRIRHGVTAMLLLAAAFLLLSFLNQGPLVNVDVLAGLVVAVSLVVLSQTVPSWLSDRSLPEVLNKEDLDRVARQKWSSRSGVASVPTRWPHRRAGVNSSDVFQRYASVAVGAKELSSSDLAKALELEPARIVRREMVRAIAERGVRGVDSVFALRLDEASLSPAVEVLGYLERSESGVGDSMDDIVRGLPERLRALAAVYGVRIEARSVLDAFLLELSAGPVLRRGNLAGGIVHRLTEAYLSDDDERLLDILTSLPERDIRRAVSVLSPFDRAGLSSFYWLSAIEDIEDVYIFFEKASFAAATGIEGSLG